MQYENLNILKIPQKFFNEMYSLLSLYNIYKLEIITSLCLSSAPLTFLYFSIIFNL